MSASKNLRLKVGRTYETASGQRVEILFFTGVYFAGRTGLYKADGTPRSLGTLPLIREVSSPKPARKPKRKAAKAVRAFYLWFPVTEDGEFEFWNAGKTKGEARPSSPGMAVVRARVEVRR